MRSLKNHSAVEKSMRRLRAMGLNVTLIPEGDNEANIFITIDSVLKLIKKGMTYPNNRVYFEDRFIVVNVWRG